MKKSKHAFLGRIKGFFKDLGPGLITGASDDDPSGIATYSQAGAQFGFNTLWTALITFPLMFAIQEMCGRIGMATSKGLITNFKEHFHPVIVYLTLIITVPAIVLNIGADLSGMGAVANLIFPKIPSYLFSIIFVIFLNVLIVFLPYIKIVNVLKYFCLVLFLYLFIPFYAKIEWVDVLKSTFVPTIKFNKEYINIVVAILGTTISPYLFFWQATMAVEDIKHRGKSASKFNMKKQLNDIGIGMFISNAIMYFIILATGAILFKNGINEITTVEQAAKALEPIAGKMCYLIFAVGIIGTGLLAIPVFCSCIAYLICSTFKFKEGLDKKLHESKIFYLIISLSLILGLGTAAIGISPIKALIYTAILYGVSAPPIMLLVILLANNKKVMKEYANSKVSNIFGVTALLLMTVAAILLLYLQF